MNNDPLIIGGKSFRSRFMIGTGKFPSDEIMNQCIAASGAELITVALRRVDLEDPQSDILSALDPQKIFILPNTSGAQNAEEAVRLAHLAAGMGFSKWVKLEITPDPVSLLPDGEETLKAAQILVKEGFTVLPYINIDPILARKLEDVGTAAVMPLASPIGTNRGLKALDQLAIILENARIPVVIDAGIGRPSDACLALEMGASAVMINTAVSAAKDPVGIAGAFNLAVQAGRQTYLSGLAPQSLKARASSPTQWISR